MVRYATRATTSLVAVVLGLIYVSATTLAAGDKSASADQHLLPQSQSVGVDHHQSLQRSQRAMSLSHKYAGLGKRLSSNSNDNDNDDDESGSRGATSSDADSLFDENDAKFEDDDSRERSPVSSSSNGGRRNDDTKRALPSSLRYTGLGKRRAGVSAAMRYAGLGKRFPESADNPETAVGNTENDNEHEGTDLEMMAAAQRHQVDGEHQLILDRRRRFAVDLLDDLDDADDDESDDVTDRDAVLYGIKRQLAKSSKPRIGVGMRYVGVGKRPRPVMNSRSRVDAGMRYMGIGKRSSY